MLQTNENNFLISIALNKILILGQIVFGISPQFPLTQELIGHEVGHSFEANNAAYVINEIVYQ